MRGQSRNHGARSDERGSEMKQRMTQRRMSRGVSRKVAQLQSPSLALSSSQRPLLTPSCARARVAARYDGL